MSLRKCSISGASAVQTPVGNLVVNDEIRQRLVQTGLFDTTSQRVDEEEHSIEMHLPYLAAILSGNPAITIVPIMVGRVTARDTEQYTLALQPYFADEHVLFVISRCEYEKSILSFILTYCNICIVLLSSHHSLNHSPFLISWILCVNYNKLTQSDFCHWGSRFGYTPYDRTKVERLLYKSESKLI